ncbi:MAG TPA: glycosyltransferase [Rhizomicrobium sp.]|jgi:glycosyltransferase involved in cell wall biosynthesis|nr:glycosyltransferase [Rhizomicrobium sp.]
MPEASPIFSVIIPHLNQPEGLEKCLASLARQTMPRELFEVIVVDNGSSAPIQPIIDRFPGMRTLQELTPGPGPARNCGARAARGSIFAFIDADCRAHPDWLNVAHEVLKRSSPGTILGGDVQIINDTGHGDSGVGAYERVFGFRFKLYVEEHGYSGTGNLIVRREYFEKVGPFVGIAFAEDVEWGGRARKEGFTFRYVPDMIVYHPARNSFRELRTKWDRHIGHELAAARQKRQWRIWWVARAVAITGSPLFDFVRPLASRQIGGWAMRIQATQVLFRIRIYRGIRMLLSLFAGRPEIRWNRGVALQPVPRVQDFREPAFPAQETRSGNSPLVSYALRGLENCWLASENRWSHIYHLDGRVPANESLPQSDVFYTLNVLLGLSRVSAIPPSIDVKQIFEHSASNLTTLPVQKYAFGTALWTSAAFGIPLPDVAIDKTRRVLSERRGWLSFTAQDLGMILAGVTAQSKSDPKQWGRFADELFRFLVERYQCRSGLFFNNVLHFRRRFTSFATHTYLTLACYIYGEASGRQDAIELANACARKLIALQGPNGEWPWFFDTMRGMAVDFYEVYSVHQYGMAPAFLEYAERHGVTEAREAIRRSVRWVLGDNQLQRPMLVPELGLTIRSQCRKGELDTKFFRMFRSMPSLIAPRAAVLTDPSNIQLRLECRSYELGWILWSFGQRDDFREFTHHPAFSGEIGARTVEPAPA